MTADLDPRRKRLLFRARHMGMNENDILFGEFAETHLAGFDDDQLDRFEALLAQADQDLFDWITRRRPVPARWDDEIMGMLQGFVVGKAGA